MNEEMIMKHTYNGRYLPVQELVRCKDCWHWTTVVDREKAEYGMCGSTRAIIGVAPKNGFCFKGERINDGKH